MSSKNLSVAIDIGTTKVCTVIAIGQGDDLEIIGVGNQPSHGLRKGAVVNIDQTVKSIRKSIDEAMLMAGVQEIEQAVIGISGNHIYSFNNSGVVAVKNKEIASSDVARVVESAKAVVIPSDREILHIIPQEFSVDNTRGVKDPVGMCGVRLEGHVHIVTAKTSLIQNLIKCVQQAGIQPREVMLQPIASSNAVLSLEEKELGVVLVDIGGGTTDIAVWQNNSLMFSQVIPVGGSHFTNDLAVALKIPHKEAEKVKQQYGTLVLDNQKRTQSITVQGINGVKPRQVPVKLITKVLQSRMQELLDTIHHNIIKKYRLSSQIPGGVILTGGGSLIDGFEPYAEYVLNIPCKVGFPLSFGSMTSIMQNPKFATVLGLLREADGTFDGALKETTQIDELKIFKNFTSSLKKTFRDIF